VIAYQGGPGRGEQIEADRVRKAGAPHGLCEIVPTRQHPLEPVRVENRVDQRFGRVKETEQLEVECDGRDDHDEPGGILQSPPGTDLEQFDRGNSQNGQPHRKPDQRIRIGAVRREPG
jgi:hypothetical protein